MTAIAQADIQFRLSGGASNTLPASSYGGAISSTAAGTDIFPNVTSAEATAGTTQYRCVYVRNGTASGNTWTGAKIWISDPNNTSGAGAYAGDTITIGIGAAAVSATETATANDTTAPASVTFFAAASEGAALNLNSTTGLAPTEYKAVWIKRVIAAGASAVNNAGFTLTAKGDTAA